MRSALCVDWEMGNLIRHKGQRFDKRNYKSQENAWKSMHEKKCKAKKGNDKIMARV